MFTSIRANPFLRWELRRSTKLSGINWSFILMRVIPLIFLTLVALIPTQYYIDDSRVDWLPWMAIILFLPRPILAIRTIFAGIQSVRQDMLQGRWELLILTGIPARKIVWRKWVKVVRHTFPDQILFTLPAIGLALSISQFFHSTNLQCFYGAPPYPTQLYQTIMLFLHPYCYNSITSYYGGGHLNPYGIVFGIGLLIIFTMTFFETSLNTSISLLAAFSNFAAKGLGIIYGVIIRGSLLGIAFLAIPLMRDYVYQSLDCTNVMFVETFTCQSSSYKFLPSVYRVTDTIELAIMPLLDQGTLLAANVMRPNDDRLLRIYFRPHDDHILQYLDSLEYEISHIHAIKSYYDNRPFVLRNLIATTISAFFFWLLIRYFLRRATRFAIVNHGASGYLEV